MHNCVGHDTIVGFCERFFFVLLSHGVWTDNASFPVANQVSTLCPPPAPSPPYSGPSAVNPSPYPVPHGLRLPDFHPSPHPGPSPVTSSPIFSSPHPPLHPGPSFLILHTVRHGRRNHIHVVQKSCIPPSCFSSLS